MIRKVIHITLVMLLLTISTGMTLYTHYCGSSRESISINSEPKSCCGDDCNCCHNESVTVKIKDNYSATVFTFDFHLLEITLQSIQLLLIKKPISHQLLLVRVNDGLSPPIQVVLSSLQTYHLWLFETTIWSSWCYKPTRWPLHAYFNANCFNIHQTI